jgi:hypothetical protein
MTVPAVGLGSAWTGPAPDLRGCWAKIDRAWEHLGALKHEIEQHPWRVAFTPVHRPWRSASTADAMEFVCVYVDTPPIRWATIVGDIVHNLRSCLDHLACQMTLANGGNCDAQPRSSFPVVTYRPKYKAIAGQSLARVDARTRAIIEALQPYHALDWPQKDGTMVYRHPLALLDRLWNFDKHNLPPLAMFSPERIELKDFEFEDAELAAVSSVAAPFRVGVVAFTVHFVPSGPNPTITCNAHLQPSVAFDDGEPLVRSLEFAAYFLAGVIREFEPDLLPPPQRL